MPGDQRFSETVRAASGNAFIVLHRCAYPTPTTINFVCTLNLTRTAPGTHIEERSRRMIVYLQSLLLVSGVLGPTFQSDEKSIVVVHGSAWCLATTSSHSVALTSGTSKTHSHRCLQIDN